ncbi:MAG: clostripain-related cysteine peptidase [Candidatus Wallbacteria bacterium]|nr:clostripain-related cysteine peptidase [Candidatus Wallbacteria bacterium]
MKLLGILFMFAFAFYAFAEQPAGGKEWTIMVYMAGDNAATEDLEGDGHIDMLEMAGAKIDNSKVNLVLLVDFGGKDFDGLYVYNGKDYDLKKKYDEINMGDPATLTGFIKDAAANYPAKKYLLHLWGHGSGLLSLAGPGTIIDDLNNQNSKSGNAKAARLLDNDYAMDKVFARLAVAKLIGTDPQSKSFAYDESSKDCITMVEFKKALNDSNLKFELISFDACIMNQVEVLYQIKDYTSNVAAAFTYFPGGGYWYTGCFSPLSDNPSIDGRTLAKSMLDNNKKFYTTEDLFKPAFVATIKQRILKSLRAKKDQVLQAMAQNNIPADQFDAFIDMYADKYISDNQEDVDNAAAQAFKMQVLNFGYMDLTKLPDFMKKLDEFIKTATDRTRAMDARKKSTSINSAFGDKYGTFYVDILSFVSQFETLADGKPNQAADELLKDIKTLEPEFIVVGTDETMTNAHVGLFFPEQIDLYKVLAKYYEPLDFCSNSKWPDFLKGLIAPAPAPAPAKMGAPK